MSELLSAEQKNLLLATARQALAAFLERGTMMKHRLEDERLRERHGVFVTLKRGGRLRGCIGFPWPDHPLDEAVQEAAVSAASKDYRFAPLDKEELHNTVIEISVLTRPVPVGSPSEIEIGKHGVIVSRGMNRGLLLPQVPVEWGWDLKTYLQNACQKAGLPKDAWQDDIRIEIFTAQVFSESPLTS